MTKEEAWDILAKFVSEGVNCWERNGKADENEPLISLAYLTGVIEALNEVCIK